MDPFNDVKDDAYSVVGRLESLISQRISGQPPTTEQSQDFDNNYEELQEMRDDLQSALEQSAKNPTQFNLTSGDISQRQAVLQDLNRRISHLLQSWDNKKLRDVTTMSNRISQDDENPFNIDTDNGGGGTENMTTYQQQELIQEQDYQLDDIHKTMMNLNQQATMMGDELDDQGYMLDELDVEMDHVGNKLGRGMKRLNIFIERNKETASNWCIGILAVVLCILLVLLIVV
ncbi:Tlg1 protein [Candida orthopsilosis Co 90-125]|uniref:t-SNARE affecting a late Golgi compartment protein 1 n=1 Tax=Candida orthopsilosis (strain 90-125) TaxID=1136231 RepID=H8X7Z1_CANO9|nr:Tlg1 protein [Candida orthopsilosis Co 90-125]CCG24090.1 Tlg1 protein [Candida orthopsilosis Co 90-125]